MNKLLIVLLAICLVSVHAFVKRDAPEAPKSETALDNILKQFGDLTNNFKDQVSQTFDPEVMKKGLTDAMNKINEAFGNNKPTSDTPK